MTTVSIITATYNRAETLPRAINSVLDQTYTDFEHVIIDDGSTDDTRDVVDSYDDQRIEYIHQENAGANAARNRGLEEASGDYISFLDSDDEYMQDRLEVMVSIFKSLGNNYGGAFHGFEVYENEELKTLNRKASKDFTFEDLTFRNHIGGFLSPIFRSEVFDEVGNLDESMESSQDYEFYLRVAEEYDFRGVNKLLGRYHLTGDSISGNIERKRNGQERILEKYGDSISSRRIADQHYYRGKILAEQGKIEEARQELVSAIKIWPRNPLYYYYSIASLFGERGYQFADQYKHRVKRYLHTYLS